MALIQYKNGTRRIVKPDIASRMWLCINGYKQPENEAQALYIAQIHKIYLGPRTKHLIYAEQQRRQTKLSLTVKAA